MKRKYTEYSIMSPGYAIIALVFFIGIAVMTFLTVSLASKQQAVPLTDYIMEAAAFIILLKIVRSRYVYELTEDELVLTEQGLFREKVLHIAYGNMIGLHYFKNQLFKPLSYRYTYRMYSKLDGRTIWSLVYTIEASKKIKYGRILIKGSDEFFNAFETSLPGKVKVKEAEVVANAYKQQELDLRAAGELAHVPTLDITETAKRVDVSSSALPVKEDREYASDGKVERKGE